MKIKTGIFGGSFNPVHIGHLALANYLCEFAGLDELWFMVSPQNPLKKDTELLPDTLRLEMVKVATRDYSKFHASDFEFSLPKPSYTINTLDKLKKTYPGREFHLIIGADNWKSFAQWKDADRLLYENFILIYPRPGYTVDKDKLPENARLVDAPLLDVSSSFIRKALKGKKDIRYFLHPDVYKILISTNFNL